MTSRRPPAAQKIVRIGGASGFWGDSMVAAPQLVKLGRLDYLVFDFLAETTMSILAAARAKRPEMGYATDFVDIAMKSVLGEVKRQGIKVVSNAGGINPHGCADALRALAEAEGISLRIAVVEGDDVSAQMPVLRERGVADMYTGEGLPEKVLSANAYLGALPIAAALAAGADVVITGRCVDSAVTLGPLMHEFGWTSDDFDLLASGSLAGHIIECGCQATGGLHTDWEDIPDWANMGYPIVECHADGSFFVTKPEGTGGKVIRAAVAEQMLYEIGDPAAYMLPDVTCDFRHVVIEQQAENRVRVSAAKGREPSPTYKVSATELDGFRCAGSLVIIGIDAEKKARRTAEAIIERTGRILRESGQPPFTSTCIEVIGSESLYGPHARTRGVREVTMRVVANHPQKAALAMFAREIAPAGTSWAPGTTGPGGGRPAVSPLIKPFSFLLDKEAVPVAFVLDGERHPVTVPRFAEDAEAPAIELPAVYRNPDEPQEDVRLIQLAWARSGDKGDLSNIGLVARRPEWLPVLWDRVSQQAVRDYLSHLVHGPVERFYLPGTASMNLVLHDALDGGGPSSMRMDPLGKGMAQMLLDMTISVPASVAVQCATAKPTGQHARQAQGPVL
ncbi:acyclic terpene utilization AtuA family protein [Variovorax sp. J22R115]|uniref:acyclic terpene utilization AtuA family protein n=1 Tax=Variovorax sp. J22R115 TaxID=3053509 RepID=UPI002577B174|nr:acyclic terpene utilization AtuA family protein [Variovorax sp. J22R115]MDM0049614.1 acyclic terpene utilization AtuA family protein [Variovorax sp. J22R115]